MKVLGLLDGLVNRDTGTVEFWEAPVRMGRFEFGDL